MKFKVRKISADAFDKPGAAVVGQPLAQGDKVTATGNVDPTGFIEVRIDADPPTDPAVWMREEDLRPVNAGDRLPIDMLTFVQQCIQDERTINDLDATKPWYVLGDYLIARALIETGIQNAGPVAGGSDAVGPLQVSSAEWMLFRTDNPGGLAAPFSDDAFDNWAKQIIGAAYRMHADAKAISGQQAANNVGTAADPFLPSYLDLFHAYLLNPARVVPATGIKGAIAILNAEKADPTQKLDGVLNGIVDPAGLAAVLARPPFKDATPKPVTVGDFTKITESALGDALKKAFDLIKEHAPEELPEPKQGEASWYDVALSLQGLDEHNVADAAKIKKFFEDTTFGPVSAAAAVPPWCGAFVAHCMAQSGSVEAKNSIPKGAAVAANWKDWGDPVNFQSGEIPVGAVVVLSPSEGTGSSGHVAFFSKTLPNGKIELLGGNQSNKSGLTPFAASKIAYVGWLNLASADRAQQSGGALSNTPISDRAIKLIVSFEVSSEDAYNKRYHRPTWPQGRSGVTIGIGYDVGYATPQNVATDWNALSPAMIAELKGCCGITGAAAGPRAKQAADVVDVPFNTAMNVFIKTDVPRWVGIVERHLENTHKLRPDSLGALVSLAYNRGPSFKKAGDRYREMNNIRNLMAQGTPAAFAQITVEIESMIRLWPDMKGLRDRRMAEAKLFRAGLAGGV